MKQTAWLSRAFDLQRDAGAWPVILCRLEGTLPHLQAMVGNRNEDALQAGAGAHWSVKAHIGHLADMEDLWWLRAQDFLQGSKVLSPADMSNAKTNASDHDIKEVDYLFQAFQAKRTRLIKALRGVEPGFVEQSAWHERLGFHMRFIDAFEFVAEHDDHHLTSIWALLNNEGV